MRDASEERERPLPSRVPEVLVYERIFDEKFLRDGATAPAGRAEC